MGFLVFTFSLHHCFLAGMQYNPNLGNDFHFGEKWSKVSILVLTLGMGTCPPQETPLLPFVCLFVVYFLSLHTSVSKQFCGAGTTTVPIGIKTVREKKKTTLSSEQRWPSRACPL